MTPAIKTASRTYQGPKFFSLNGEVLSDMRREMEKINAQALSDEDDSSEDVEED